MSTHLELYRLIERTKNPEEPAVPNKMTVLDGFRYSKIGEESSEYLENEITGKMLGSAIIVLLERFRSCLDLLPEHPQLVAFRKALEQQDELTVIKNLDSFRAYLETHPGNTEQFPLLDYVAHLKRKDLFHFLHIREEGYTHPNFFTHVTTYKKRYKEQPDELYTDRSAIVALLGIGRLHPAAIHDAYVKTEANPEEITELIALFRIAERMYGKEWRRVQPDIYDRVNNVLADAEWKYANPIFSTAEDRTFFKEFDRMTPVLAPLALDGEARMFTKQHFSWRYLLKQLIEEPKDLEERFLKVPLQIHGEIPDGKAQYQLRTTSIDDWQFYIDDPRFGMTLFEIGSRLAPLDPELQDPLTRTPKQLITIAKSAIRSWGVPGSEDQKSEIHKIYLDGIRRLQWETIAKFRDRLDAVIHDPEMPNRAERLLPGPYRDTLLYEAWKRDHGTERPPEWYLTRLDARVPDAARGNRAPDLMNRYVRNHYVRGTEMDDKFREHVRSETLDRHGIMDEEMRKKLHDATFHPYYKDGEFRSIDFDREIRRAHEHRKEEARKTWRRDHAPGITDLYIFSSTIHRNDSSRTFADVAFRPNIIAEAAKHITNPETLEHFVCRWIPDTCQFRDYYLENAFHMRLWSFLQTSSLASKLTDLGITYRERSINLKDHLGDHDEGVLTGAYMTSYVLGRVEGLAGHVNSLTVTERERLSIMMRELASRTTPRTSEEYERLAISLELPMLHERFDETKRAALPRDRVATSTEQAAAQARAFNAVIERIRVAFPHPSYYRDGLLESVALDMTSTPDQAKEIEHMTYTYLVRNPAVEKKQKEIVAFSPIESVKNYLAAFQDASMRGKVLSWIFNGELTDDRYLEGITFHINADKEREAFWAMSDEERKVILYYALLGSNGLFEVSNEHQNESSIFGHDPREMMNQFLDAFYKNNFESMLTNEVNSENLRPVLQSIFSATFNAYSPARRVELLCAITEKMAELRKTGQELTAGQAIRLFLEQIGVVGVKAGQVLSEHPELVPNAIQSDLSSLRDRAKPFSKFGVFTYLRVAKLFGEQGTTNDIRITGVGECLGSASIKQVHTVTLESGEQAVVKVPRPSIDKNFEEDVRVLDIVIKRLQREGVDVPEYLLTEIVEACRGEFDFEKDANAQRELGTVFEKRHAEVQLDGKRFPMTTPQLLKVIRKGETRVNNLQLIVEERARGLSLVDIEALQSEPTRKEEIETRIQHLYGHEAGKAIFAYRTLNLRQIRTQIACDLLQQITQDGIFQADAHAGNFLVDLAPGAERLVWIDFGSVGHSASAETGAKDHRHELELFLQSLFQFALGMSNTQTMAEIISANISGSGRETVDWSKKIAMLHTEEKSFGAFFKDVTAEILSSRGKIDQTFRLFVKALAAGGGHFDALAQTIKDVLPKAMERKETDSRLLKEILLEEPGFEKLLPILEGVPEFKAMLET